MSFFGNILPFVGDSVGEIFNHPLQAAGAALGVPGYDPFFGGLFNNKPGGALISPTGNFTSSAWQDMYNRNPGDAGALNQFAGINSVADKVAPMIAAFYAAPAMGAAMGGAGGSGAAGAGAGAADAGATGASTTGVGSGLSNLFSGAGSGATSAGATGAGTATGGQGLYGLFGMGSMNGAGVGTGLGTNAVAGSSGLTGGAGGLTGFFSGPAALGDAGLTGAVGAGGSGMGAMTADMGGALGSSPAGLFSGLLPGGGMSGTASGALGGGLSGSAAGAAPLGDASMGGFSMPGTDSTMQQAQRLMQMRNQQQQQQQPQVVAQTPNFPQNRFGGTPRPAQPIGPSMSYASFNGAQTPVMNNPFGFGSAYGTL